MLDDDEPRADELTATPRWVKVFAAVAIVVLVAFVLLLVFGGGHGPRRHGAPTTALAHVFAR